MQWLVIALLVSLVALLLAVAGVARHIRRQHRHAAAGKAVETMGAAEEVDVESDH